MASIRKLYPKGHPKHDESPWIVEYTDKLGKRRRATPKSGLMKDAKSLRTKIEAELEGGHHIPTSQAIPVGDAIDLWLAECDSRVLAQDRLRRVTVTGYRGFANRHVRPALGRVSVTDLTLRQIQAWVDDMAFKQGVGRPTIEAAFGTLRLVVRYAHRSGLVARNVFDGGGIRIPGRPSRRIEIPTKEQVRQLLAGSDMRQRGGSAPYLRPMIHVAVYAGLRAGEIRGLCWEHVDFDKGMIRVRQAMDRWGTLDDPKTHSGDRDIPMPPPLITELREWSLRNGRPESGLLFTGRGGWVQMAALDQSWRRLARRVFEGVAARAMPEKSPFHFHALRHVYASLLIEAGLPPKRIQYLMGHASITITFDRYGHLFEDPELVRNAMDKLGSGLVAAG